MEKATGAPACGAETVLIDWETWDAEKVERMGRAFQRNVCHPFFFLFFFFWADGSTLGPLTLFHSRNTLSRDPS